MFLAEIGYNKFVVPDEVGPALLEVMSRMKTVNSKGWGRDEVFTYSEDPIEMKVQKIPDEGFIKEPEPKETQ